MTRVQRSQIKEILLQLTDLENRLKAIYREDGIDMSTREKIAIKKTLAGLKATISDLTEVI